MLRGSLRHRRDIHADIRFDEHRYYSFAFLDVAFAVAVAAAVALAGVVSTRAQSEDRQRAYYHSFYDHAFSTCAAPSDSGRQEICKV